MPNDKAPDRAYYEAFRQRLKSIREDLDWSQAEMASALGIPLDNYKKYEIRSKFPAHLIEKFALVTHRNVEFIVIGRGPNVRTIQRRTATQ